MKTNVSKWGNSLALRIPAHIAAELKLIDGTEVELKIDENRLLVKRALKSWSLEELLDGVTRDNIHKDPWGENDKDGVFSEEELEKAISTQHFSEDSTFAVWASQGQGGVYVNSFATVNEAKDFIRYKRSECSWMVRPPQGYWHSMARD